MGITLSKENWIKGVFGLAAFKTALIPMLKGHYLNKARQWNTNDDHLNHLLDIGAKFELKGERTKGPNSEFKWSVNCDGCRPILSMIQDSHRQPERLLWINNDGNTCPNEYRLAKIYMSLNKESKDFSDLDPLAVLNILRNDKSFEHFYYEALNLILFRNRLMHSSDNCIGDDELEAAFSAMKKILEDDRFKNLEECKAAIKCLDVLQENDETFDESHEVLKLALVLQKKALKSDGIKTPSPGAMKILLKKIKAELEEEKMQKRKLESRLSKSEEQRKKEQEMAIVLQSKNEKLVNELLKCDPSLADRIAKGAITGTAVGMFCGSVGARVGGAAGGVVGGVSYFWDKVL